MRHQQQAALILGIRGDDECGTSLVDECHAADDPAVGVAAALAEMIVANHGHVQPCGQFAQRLKNGPDFRVAVTVHLSQVALGFRPCWALGSVGAIAAFPILPGIETIILLGETDDTGASARAVKKCGQRWHDAGREVRIVKPRISGDLNDVLRRVA